MRFPQPTPPEEKDYLGLTGTLCVKHYRQGILLAENNYKNTITNMGVDEVAGLINGQRTGAFTRIGLGTSGTQAGASNTALLAEISTGSLARASTSCTQVTTDVTNDTAQLLHTWSATGSYTVKEAGIFDSASGGRILSRKTFTGYSVVSGDSFQINWKIDVD